MVNKLEMMVQFAAIDKLTAPIKKILNGSNDLARALKAQQQVVDKIGSNSKLIQGYTKATDALKANSLAIDESKAKHSELLAKLEASRKNHTSLGKDIAVARREHAQMIAGLAVGAAKVPGYSFQLERSREKLGALEEQYKRSSNAIRNNTESIKLAEKEVKVLTSQHETLSNNLSISTTKLNAASIQVKDLAHQESLLKLSAYSANGELARQSAELEKLNKKMAKSNANHARYASNMRDHDKMLGASVKAGVASAAITAPIIKIASAYAEAETAATDLKVAMMDKTGKVPATFERINALANQLGNKLPGTTAEYQNMMTMLVRQGMSAEAILGGLGKSAAYLGVTLKMPMEDAAKFMSQLQDATGATEKEMFGLADTIQRSFNLGVDTNNMLQAFKGLSKTMDILKLKGLEGTKALTPFMIMMDQTGMAGESAGNAISKVVSRSLDKEKLGKTNKLLEGSGITLNFADKKGEFAGMDNLMQQLAKLKKLSTVDRLEALKELYGDDNETNQVLSKMIEKGVVGYKEIQSKLERQANLERRVTEQLGTLSNLYDAAAGTFTNAMVALGESISPELKSITEWLGKVAEKMQIWAKANPELSNTILKTIAIIGGLLAAFSAVALVIAGLIAPIALITFALGLLGVTVAVSSIAILGFLAIGAAIGALARYIYNNWDGISAWFKQLWESVKTAISEAWTSVSNFVGKWVDAGKNLMIGFGDGIMSGLGWIKEKITGAGEKVIGWFKEKLGIHSPSRVFAELGNYTMLGLGKGLGDGEGDVLNRVRATAKAMAGIGAGMVLGTSAFANQVQFDTRAPIGKAGGGGGYTPAVINITINTTPGQNAQDIAQQVAQAIQQHEQRKATRARSSMRDTE